MRPVDLRCEHRCDVPCLDEPAPRLGWALESPEREKRQSAYRIRVRAGDAVLWDSGRVESSRSVDVVYAGRALPPAATLRTVPTEIGSGTYDFAVTAARGGFS